MSNMPKDGKDLQVYAEIAKRIGVLSKQYERLSKKSLKYKVYDVTLHICLLQTILTNVIEQLYGRFGFMEWSKGFFSNNIRNKTESRRIGLNIKDVNGDYDQEVTTIIEVLRWIRNALSHPCKTFPQKSKYPSTGYWIPKSNTGKIEKITFIFSPHSKNNNFREFRSEVEAIEYISRKCLDRLNVVVACNEINNRYYLVKDNNIYAPKIIINLSVNDLKIMVRELSTLLAQPLRKGWPKGEDDLGIVKEDTSRQIRDVAN